MRAVIASAGNDHRLGANEAPPAIISIFLGDQLADVFQQIGAGGAKTSKAKGTLNIGVDVLPPLPKDAGDRNRTSPFAFTGNKFEFRAVGSNQSIGAPIMVLNVILAEALDEMATALEAAGPDNLNATVQKLLKDVVDQHGTVIFNGNGYSEEWHAQAAKRGLPNLKTSVDALPTLTAPATVAVFEKYGILTKRELESRLEIAFEQYVKTVNVEANLTADMARTAIFPAAMRYQGELAATAASLKTAGLEPHTAMLSRVTDLMGQLMEGVHKLDEALAHESHGGTADHAKHFRDDVLPAMLTVRETADTLEEIVADDLWPLPKYQEMLFIK